MENSSVDWAFFGDFLGSLGLFLFGMRQITEAAKELMPTGDQLRLAIHPFVSNSIRAAGVGMIVSAMLQSSTIVSILCIQFVNSGQIQAQEALAMLIGGGFGTTFSSQILSFNVSKAALAMIGLGHFGSSSANLKIRVFTQMLFGLGMTFFSLKQLNLTVSPLKDLPTFVEFLKNSSNPWIGILTSSIFTALIQSSNASVGIIIAFIQEKMVTLPFAVSLVLGANIGTCITPLIFAFQTPKEVGVRVAELYLFTRVIGALALVIFAYNPFISLIDWTSESEQRKVANCHSIFNLFGTFFARVLTTQLASHFCRF